MLCLEGETWTQSSIINVLKAIFVPFWNPSRSGYFMWKHIIHVLTLDFCGKLPRRLCVCAWVYWFMAPHFATPSMCVSGVEVPQESECLSMLVARIYNIYLHCKTPFVLLGRFDGSSRLNSRLNFLLQLLLENESTQSEFDVYSHHSSHN